MQVKAEIRLVSSSEQVAQMPEALFTFRQQSGVRSVESAKSLLEAYSIPLGWYDQKKGRLYWWAAKRKKELVK